MKLSKREKTAIAKMLEVGAETPEVLAEECNSELDKIRGERTYWFGIGLTGGVSVVVGPFTTRGQVVKALDKNVEKFWAVPGYTAEGWVRHLAEVDAPPPEPAEEKAGKDFWPKAMAIKNGEQVGIIAQSIKVVKP